MTFFGMIVNAEVSALPYYLQIFISNFVVSQLFSKLTTEASSVHRKNNKQTKPHFLFYSNNV